MNDADQIVRVRFAITNSCNLSCHYCYMNSNYIMYEELTTNKVKKLLNLLKKIDTIRYITFSGGEPLLRRDLVKILKEAVNLDYTVSVSTNATLITESIAHLLSKLVEHVSVGLDGSSAKLNAVTRDSKMFRKVLEGIKALVKNGVNVYINTVLTQFNAYDIPNLLRLADSLGVKLLHVSKPILSGRATSMMELVPSQKVVRDVLELSHRIIKEKCLDIKMSLDPLFLVMSPNISNFNELIFVGNVCEMPDTLSILPDGTLVPCLPMHAWIKGPNLLKYGLEKVLK